MPSIDKVKKFKPRVMCWNDLTLENIDDILKFNSAEETQSYLADIFHLENHTEDLKAGILIDLYYYSLQFAIDGNFNREQISAFFSIVKSVHEMAVDTPFGNVDPVYEYCKELILCHSVKRPPFSIELYTVDQVKKITTYIVNTYFRHYKMYKYAFTPKVRLDLSIEYVGLPETPAPSEGEEENVEGTESEEAVTGEEQSVEAPEEEQIEAQDQRGRANKS
ncbi:cilia- and flagella-associated protein 119 isoform X2 [Nematostella vectensis]|uniref:cilia- and flagella-associated protein 119 isoform X2 n=1 Tax=Nematostella vectensis TaxID=45351 RepID=UPI002077041B|nr:cilia- and flagella-associated protein 119 isoform X2 [Nematostella vectensis]